MTAPYLLKVTSGGNDLYSVAIATGTVNTHPFTDLIIRNWYKVKGADVGTVFGTPGALSPLPVAGEINTIEAVLRNILATGLSQVGLTTTFNLISSPFNADGTGFDQVLDNTTVAISPTGQVTLTTFDPTTGMGQTTISTNISTDLTTSDGTKPSNPSGLTARSGGASKILLGWNTSTDNMAIAGYNIFRDGGQIAAVPYPTYTDSGLSASTNHCYQVEAFDGAGNISAAKSNQACAATNAGTLAIGAKFPIATTPTFSSGGITTGRELSINAAFDGTNYLIGVQGDSGKSSNTTAQLMSSSGSLIGGRISAGGSGGVPSVAFNGTNYLLIWSTEPPAGNAILGRVFNTSGGAVTAPVAISTSVGTLDYAIKNIACSSTKCTVVWTDKNSQGTVYGRDIGPAGALLTAEYTIFASPRPTVGASDSGVDCDSSGNCLFVADSGSEILGRIIGQTINKAQFVIATKSQLGCTDHNPVGVTFDGTNYLVVWNDHSDCTPVPNWDVMGQRLDASGNLLGTAFKVNSANTNRAALPSLAFDGTNFLVTWNDGRTDANKNGACDSGEGTCEDVYGQYVSKTGSLVGSEFVINADAGNQIGVVTGLHAGKYLVILNTGFPRFVPGAAAIADDVYGVFVTP